MKRYIRSDTQSKIYINRRNGEIITEDWLRLVDSIAPYIRRARSLSAEKIQGWCVKHGVDISLDEADELWDCVLREDDSFIND